MRPDPPPFSPPRTEAAPSSWRARAEAYARDGAFRRARRALERTDARTLDDQAALAVIPAPSFEEAERGRAMAARMAEAGLEVFAPDAVGNIVGWFPASGAWRREAPVALPLVVSAHLDTVFAAATPIRLHREGDTLRAPGITDDARGLAALLALSRAARAGGLTFRAPLLVVATVGEEGAGNLRGVRHLFSAEGAFRHGVRAFISLDGAGIRRIIHCGVGSLRYRAILRGPGGHSWADYGTPNPLHVLAAAVDGLLRISRPTTPRTTLSVGRWGGGTSINAIPTEGWVEFEVRSEDEAELARMDLEVRRVLDRVIRPSDAPHPLRLEVEGLGDRPAGRTPADHPLVEAALAATRALGHDATLDASSTDANLPMSLGLPAITVGAGGHAGQVHTPDEWYRNVEGPDGIARALLTLLLIDRG